LTSQFEKLAEHHPLFANVEADVAADGRVTLRGEVPSAEDRSLIEIVIRLQPGVRSVQNEVTLAGTTPDPGELRQP
jgi:osmotically-inducible protein OsmY